MSQEPTNLCDCATCNQDKIKEASKHTLSEHEELFRRLALYDSTAESPSDLKTEPRTGPLPQEGVKHDQGKPKLSLLTRESLAAEARAFEYGMRKYSKNNYKQGMDWSRVIDALMRHTAAFNSGESVDPESGLCHLDHIKACAAMLVYYYENKIGNDDR